jgi:bacterial leucyl aminopeptidase
MAARTGPPASARTTASASPRSTAGRSLPAGRSWSAGATVGARATFADDVADFFFAADAQHPVWQLAGSVTPTGPGPQTLEAAYKLPPGARQVVRVQFRSGGGATACAAGAQDDRDDLLFAVAP